jgi:putative peptide zinc metalloprotease protein
MSKVMMGQPQIQMKDRLADVQVGVRPDLSVTRHDFRGKSTYVVMDPITHQAHALQFEEYEILIRIHENETLSSNFEFIVEDEILSRDREDEFYDFVLKMHQLGFLSLPISSDKALYKRFERRRMMRRRELLFAFISFRVPLVNPDRFLERTVAYTRFLFSKTFLIFWALLMAAAGFMIWQGRADALATLPTLIQTNNLIVMWFVLIGLKIIHEFGHAYACKQFGGHVPEMGAFFILMTPCAYMNATSAWEFPQKHRRLIVGLGGMYFESMVAAIATFVWFMTEPSMTHSIAFQILFLASITTIGFNANPLMRFDGYFIATDSIEIPNLRSRAQHAVSNLAARVFVGVRGAENPDPARVQAYLLLFGIAATLYRLVLIWSISLLLAIKFSLVGLGLAIIYVGMQLFRSVTRTIGYLWFAEITAPVRRRAIAVSMLILVGIPAAILAIPVPGTVSARGIVSCERLDAITVTTPGFVRKILTRPGETTESGATLAVLENGEIQAEIAQAEAELDVATVKHVQALNDDSTLAYRSLIERAFHTAKVDTSLSHANQLTLVAETEGIVLECLDDTIEGRFLNAGNTVAVIGSGRPVARLLLTEDEIITGSPFSGQVIEYRSNINPRQVQTGTILSVAEVGSRRINSEEFSRPAGGDIDVTGPRGEAARPYFEVVVALGENDPAAQWHGSAVQVCIPAASETLGRRLHRGFVGLVNRIRTGA